MRRGVIDQLCDAINAHRGVTYPQRGYTYFADIRGDGQNRRRVYVITGDRGSVSACHNGATYRQTADNLREILATQNIF